MELADFRYHVLEFGVTDGLYKIGEVFQNEHLDVSLRQKHM